jgi:peptidoglycan/LPS O-acetylase OafA/YrhL
VDLFFVLSGFLITGILFDAKGKDGYFKTFYARRALRIFPLYYAVLAVVFFVAPLVPTFRGETLDGLRRDQAWAWLYGVNVLDVVRGRYSMPYLDHFWSLAVEEHFYFVWPLVVWLCSRRALLVTTVAVVVASFAARAVGAELGVPSITLYVLTPFRLDALCIGGFLAVWGRGDDGFAPLGRAARKTAFVAAAIFLGTYVYNHFSRTLWPALHELRATTFSVGFAALIMHAMTASARSPVSRFLRAPWLRRLGTYSYGLYVFHHFISYAFIVYRPEAVFGRWIGSHTLAIFLLAAAGFAVSYAVAILSFRFFESKMLALKRFWPSSAS